MKDQVFVQHQSSCLIRPPELANNTLQGFKKLVEDSVTPKADSTETDSESATIKAKNNGKDYQQIVAPKPFKKHQPNSPNQVRFVMIF